MAVIMKMAVFWVVAPCRLVEVYRRFGGDCCLHYQGKPLWRGYLSTLLPFVASTSETSVNFYQNTWRNKTEDSHLQFTAIHTLIIWVFQNI
jgi:hypothetical protein